MRIAGTIIVMKAKLIPSMIAVIRIILTIIAKLLTVTSTSLMTWKYWRL